MSTIAAIAKTLRYHILTSTTAAGSGHPTSSLSAVELMATLFFDGFYKFRVEDPSYANNDRLIFSKGHAAPLLYALWAVAGAVPFVELQTLRKFGSRLEGHPTPLFPYTEAATGSLGQGLSVGVGMALHAKYLQSSPYRTYVLLGDSEMAEGSVWEAIQIAAHYQLDNLVGIIDVNRLGQRGETLYGYAIEEYEKRVAAFGWHTIVVDGHDCDAVHAAYAQAATIQQKPVMIIAKTVKGKGVSLFENQENWHGKPLSQEQLVQALTELGDVQQELIAAVAPAPSFDMLAKKEIVGLETELPTFAFETPVSTRKAYGMAIAQLGSRHSNIVVLDAETSNSTYAEIFKKEHPERFFEMYIAEQNMVGTALGLARRGAVPFVSTFAAFFTRAFDQIRMAQYSEVSLICVGSHAGVSIGEDGASQMGLEDIAMFRSLIKSTVLYPSDATATVALTQLAYVTKGIVYVRTTRKDTPVLYASDTAFRIGGSHILRKSDQDVATVVASGITVHEALKAYEQLLEKGIHIRVIDCYSIKPIDAETLHTAAQETMHIITVEDHGICGGLGEAVATTVNATGASVRMLGVRHIPSSGKPEELFDDQGISFACIAESILQKLNAH